jgi:hypothetical protein
MDSRESSFAHSAAPDTSWRRPMTRRIAESRVRLRGSSSVSSSSGSSRFSDEEEDEEKDEARPYPEIIPGRCSRKRSRISADRESDDEKHRR